MITHCKFCFIAKGSGTAMRKRKREFMAQMSPLLGKRVGGITLEMVSAEFVPKPVRRPFTSRSPDPLEDDDVYCQNCYRYTKRDGQIILKTWRSGHCFDCIAEMHKSMKRSKINKQCSN